MDGLDDQKTYDCPHCKDEEGFFVRDENGPGTWRDCSCLQWKRVLRVSRITPDFKNKTFGNFSTKDRPMNVVSMFEAAKEYAFRFETIREERQNSIALLGVPGTGKSHLLMATSNVLMGNYVPVVYFPWVEGFNELKADLNVLDEKIYKLQRVDVLYIDDLFKGRSKPTEFQIEQLFAIVNDRYLNHRPILVSSEWSIDDICRVDMGLGSRIYEMCKDYTVHIKGDPVKLNYRLA